MSNPSSKSSPAGDVRFASRQVAEAEVSKMSARGRALAGLITLDPRVLIQGLALTGSAFSFVD